MRHDVFPEEVHGNCIRKIVDTLQELFSDRFKIAWISVQSNVSSSDVPRDVVRLISHAMAKADADRIPSAALFAREIERVTHKLFPGMDMLDASTHYMDV